MVALSGGYSADEANARFRRNADVIASFSRVLAECLSANQTDEQFNTTLEETVQNVYDASINK